ncbi:Integrin alpha-E [Galemys pyrenaicus]|uniref:Integrin alpha-E n=1 Tax=Galemys pyrenaicus TaxID=202257 RepID=A0A8J6AUZ3_GALPY|nr:Integrin alpha-E [Galemys pyrenaicus]
MTFSRRQKNVEWLSLQAHTQCNRSEAGTCGSSSVQQVQDWYSENCTIASAKENVTVTAELSLSGAKQLPTDVTELHILGEISFDKNLYEGLNTENNRTTITVIFLKDEVSPPMPLVIGSSVGGLVVLIVIIIILFKTQPEILRLLVESCAFLRAAFWKPFQRQPAPCAALFLFLVGCEFLAVGGPA